MNLHRVRTIFEGFNPNELKELRSIDLGHYISHLTNIVGPYFRHAEPGIYFPNDPHPALQANVLYKAWLHSTDSTEYVTFLFTVEQYLNDTSYKNSVGQAIAITHQQINTPNNRIADGRSLTAYGSTNRNNALVAKSILNTFVKNKLHYLLRGVDKIEQFFDDLSFFDVNSSEYHLVASHIRSILSSLDRVIEELVAKWPNHHITYVDDGLVGTFHVFQDRRLLELHVEWVSYLESQGEYS